MRVAPPIRQVRRLGPWLCPVRTARTRRDPTTNRAAGDTRELIAVVRDGLSAATLCAYAQGMALLRAGSTEYRWDINPREISRIWKGGCIIRARLLDPIMQAFERAPDLPNLLLDPDIRTRVVEGERAWRRAVRLGTKGLQRDD